MLEFDRRQNIHPLILNSMALSNTISKQLPCTKNMKKIQRDKKGILFQSKATTVILMLNFTENKICMCI